jgi:transcriptional regulator with PAS, ATPase and Fis domain
LFLDEVGELSPATQVKLLRFLQSHEIRRVGETEARYLDVRIVAATNRDLQQAMEQGNFREDLYYRLNTFHLHLPPLRERRVVIPTLVRYFVLKNQEATGKEIKELEPAAQYALSKYAYPGNIRELENIVEHAIVLSEDGIIRLEDLPESVQEEAREKTLAIAHQKSETKEVAAIPLQSSNTSPKQESGRNKGESDEDESEILSLEEMERRHILHALSVCKNNKTEVCKRLGISRATLWRKLKELQIAVED